jgi:virulence-associated protein VagC
MDMEIQQKILSPEELFYEAQQSRIHGTNSQRIISPERRDLQEKLHTQFAEDFLDERVGSITYPAAETASFRARNYEEAVLIFRIIVLKARLADKPDDALKQELASAVHGLETVREGLPKYLAPTPRDWNKFSAISKLLSFYVLNAEAKRALRKKLESFSIEQIQKKTAVFEAKDAEAAAAQSKKGIFGGLFGRTRKGRKGRKTRKN